MTHRFEIRESNAVPLARPFFLVIVDYDSQRFTLEGPIFDLEPWDKEVMRIRRAGREVWSFPTEMRDVKNATDVLKSKGFDEWPIGSIVDMPADTFQNLALGVSSHIAPNVPVPAADNKSVSRNVQPDASKTAAHRKSVVRRRNKYQGRSAVAAGT